MLTFPNITPAVFEAVKSELAKAGTVTPISPNTYQMEGSGIKATVTFGADSQMVAVTITDKPWYITENAIASKIREAIRAAGGTA